MNNNRDSIGDQGGVIHAIPSGDQTSFKIMTISMVVAVLVFVFDLAMPVDVAFGMPYAVLVLMGFWFSKRGQIYILASLASVFTVIGLLVSPNEIIPWIVILNRGMALFAIWFTATVIVASRKLARKSIRELERSEQRFRDVAESASDWIWEMGPDLQFSYFSERFYEVTGLQSEDVIDTSRTGHVDSLDLAANPEKWQHLFAKMDKHKPFRDFEYDLKVADGSIRYVRTTGIPVFGANGSFEGYRGTGTDVTDQKKVTDALQRETTRIQGIVDNVMNGIVTINEQGIIESFNPAAEKMFGYPAAEVIGHNVNILMLEPDKGRHDSYIQNYVRTGKGNVCGIGSREVMAQRRDGGVFQLELVVSEMHIGECPFFIGVLVDITQRKLVEEKLRKLSRAVEYSSSAVIITDTYSKIEYINPKFTEITGYSWDEAIGESPRILKSGHTSDAAYQELKRTIASDGEWKGELHNRKKDGSLYWARNSISGVKDDSGVITHYISIHEDVTREMELKHQISYQASHDDLTGLISRSEFERRAERLLLTTQQDKSDHALCFMDLDQFKIINDTCGHVAGDELLRQLSQVLRSVVRQRDTLARLGGDEFGVLIEHCSLEQAQRVADTLRQAIEKFQFSWEGQPFRVGVSIGLVKINKTTPNLTELLKQADAACYMAKDLGRNRIHTYYPDDVELARRLGQMQWATGINQALEENRFCLYAQAIVPLGSGAGRHCELLLRMLSEEGEIIPPNAFLPAAERYDLIGLLDAWVIHEAFTLLAANPAFVKQVDFITINLSGPSLTNGDFLDSIISQLKIAGIEPSKICFEVTETVAISNLSAAITFIEVLKQVGCHFALDDFGSG
ncbi:MAG: PAS domain S-box protein, partial [Gammaproteobacteria bacterium]|nr:PAS domain S-box protein [Gammaproteobacteria bacterium]